MLVQLSHGVCRAEASAPIWLCGNFSPALLFFHWFLANRSGWICDLAKEVLLQFETLAQLLGVMELGFALPLLSLGIQCRSDCDRVGQLSVKGQRGDTAGCVTKRQNQGHVSVLV